MTQKQILAFQTITDPQKAFDFLRDNWKDSKVYDQPRVVDGNIFKFPTLEASFAAGSQESVMRAIKGSCLCQHMEQQSASYVRIVMGVKLS